MWVNYPHMPTGAPASRALFEKIIDFGRRHGIVIAHDNPYSFILNSNPLSILSIPGAKDIAVELNSLSKSHNMAGWRVGMIASNPEFVKWFIKVKSNVDSGQFRPVMEAAICALRQPDAWYENLNEAYSRRRAVAEKIMTALGCTFDPGQKGLFYGDAFLLRPSRPKPWPMSCCMTRESSLRPDLFSGQTDSGTYAYRCVPTSKRLPVPLTA